MQTNQYAVTNLTDTLIEMFCETPLISLIPICNKCYKDRRKYNESKNV